MVIEMKKLTAMILGIGLAFSVSADSKISWQDPQAYRDIEAADESQRKFQQRVFKQLEQHLDKLSQVLPEGQKLWLNVTDLDLAGKVLPGYAHGINSVRDFRVTKRIDFPQISFSYRLTDANGKVLISGDETIKDMGFQDKIHSRKITRDHLGYEKRMLKEWFDTTFSQQVASK